MPPQEPESTEIPTNGGEIITREFLENVLASEGLSLDKKLTSYSATLGTKPGDNYMSIIYSVELELEEGERKEGKSLLKRHFLIKCYPNHPGRQGFLSKSNLFFKEMEIYSKWMPELRRFQEEVVGLKKEQVVPLPYARYIHGQSIDFQSDEGLLKMGQVFHSLDNYIVLEDLRKSYGFRMTNRRESLDLEHMLLVVKALARVHALSWAYRHHVEQDIVGRFPCLVQNFDEQDQAVWVNIVSSNLEQCKEIFDDEFGPGNEYTRAAERFNSIKEAALQLFSGSIKGDEAEKLLRITPIPEKFGKNEKLEDWKIICHGDCWSNNMMFRYDEASGKPLEIALVDLQMAQESCVVNDLQYVVYACTDGELRKKHLPFLLQVYHDTFNATCALLKAPTLPGFNMDSLNYRFHRAKLLGFFMAATGLPLMLKEEDKVVNMEEMGEDVGVEDAFKDVSSGAKGNVVLRKRIIEVTRDMMEDGVL